MSLEPLPADWTSWDVAQLEQSVRYHNQRYWDANDPVISDYDYDRIVQQLKRLKPDSDVLVEMGPSGAAAGEPVDHKQAMLSLDKAYDEKTLLHWATKFNGDLVMTPKVDGVACSIRYDAKGRLVVAATRGSGSVGENITANVSRIVDVPTRIATDVEVEVRGEVYLPLSTFESMKGDFANPRNTAAGALKQKDPDKSARVGLRFFLYDVIGNVVATEIDKFSLGARWGFNPVEHRLVSRDQVQSGYDDYVKRRGDLDFEIDGVVFKANRLDEQKRLGATAHHPRYAIAYKLQGESAQTVLRDIEWSVSRTGALTPVGLVDPVSLSGATVTRISLHNWGLVQSKNLSLNATVIAMRRGGVIPHLEHVVEPGDQMIFPPATCPSCGSIPVVDGEFVECQNRAACPAQVVGVLSHFAKVAGIEGFGQVWLETFVASGILMSPSDFYRIGRDDLIQFDRMGETLADKLIAQIEASKSISLSVFLHALGIPDLGKTASETLADQFKNLDKIRTASPQDLETIPGFGQLLAERIPNGLIEHGPLIDELVTFIDIQTVETAEQTEGPLTGQSFLFTGTLTKMTRSEAQSRVSELGGKAASGVSKALTYLVIGDAGRAGGKLAKAEKLGVRILTESEFMDLID
ncbi:MAG: NAD-dependent DNA ligase LigA [Myxococcota bacterium]|nr:NAD-dependent DNA ligase LigA [Myxococcota bacterium]